MSIQEDSLKSRQVAKIIDLLCEGEIEGFPSASGLSGTAADNAMMKDVFFDNTQVLRSSASNSSPSDEDWNFNISRANFEFRSGTQTQTYLENVGDSNQTTIQVNKKVVKATPITETITDSNVDAVRVMIGTPQLQIYESDGDVTGSSIEFKIEVSYNGGTYATVVPYTGTGNETIKGRTADLYQRNYLIYLSGTFPVTIRVTRVSDDPTPGDNQLSSLGDLYWYTYTEKILAKTRYPNSALFGLKINAEQFNAIPQRSYKLRGLKIKIPAANGGLTPTVDSDTGAIIYPSNYVFAGTLGAAQWCTDPAWILFDLLTSRRYGLGTYLEPGISSDPSLTDKLDVFSFYTASKYSSALNTRSGSDETYGVNGKHGIPNGIGGFEPRFSCNCMINSEQEAYTAINNLCSVFRAMPYWSSGTLNITQDAPNDYVYLFTNSNVTEKGFTYQGTSLKTRHTCVLVSWFNMDTKKPEIEVVEDEEAIAKFGIIKTQVQAFATTSRSQARRVGEWLLWEEQNASEIVSFTAGIEAGAHTRDTDLSMSVPAVRPGELIKISDSARAGAIRGGRISEGSTRTSIKLDKSTFDLFETTSNFPTFALNLMVGDGNEVVVLENSTVATASDPAIVIPGTIMGTGGNLESAPFAGAPYTISTPDVKPTTWKIISVTEVEGFLYEITAVAYNNSKYDHIERDIPLRVRQVSNLNEPPATPTNLTSEIINYKSEGRIMRKIIINWQDSLRATSYEVEYRFTNGNWNTSTTKVSDFEIDAGLRTDTLEVNIRALNINNKASSDASMVVPYLKKDPPANLSSLLIAPINKQTAELSWPQSTDTDVKTQGTVQIRHSPLTDGCATWGKANDIVPAVNGSSTRKIVPLDTGTYLIRPVDSLDNKSTSPTSVVVTMPNPQDELVVQTYREDQ